MPVRPLTPELAEKARKELNEDPKRLEEDLRHIKEWIAKQPHLCARTDDQWLTAFLRGCKFSLERTKEKLDLYYASRKLVPELYRIKHTDPRFFEILDLGSFIIMPVKSGTEPCLSIIRPGAYDANKYSVTDIVSVSYVLQKIVMMENDNAIVAGARSILDLDNVTMGHFLQMTPATSKKMVVTSQDAMPFRMKGVHYLNTPPGFEQVFNLIKNMLHEKNQRRLYVHNKNFEEMYKYICLVWDRIAVYILPEEYGGSAGTIREITDYWKKKVEEYSSWLEEDEKFGTDESKRPGKPKTAEDMFGLEGSFRQLQVD